MKSRSVSTSAVNAVGGVLVVAGLVPLTFVAVDQGDTDLSPGLALAFLVAALLSALVATATSLSARRLVRRRQAEWARIMIASQSDPRRSLEQDLTRLSKYVTDANNLIRAVEPQLAARARAVQRMQNDAAEAEQLANLSQESAEAVRRTLQEAALGATKEAEERAKDAQWRFFWLGATVSFFTSIAGGLVLFLIVP